MNRFPDGGNMGTTTPERARKLAIRSLSWSFPHLLREDGNSYILCWVGIIASRPRCWVHRLLRSITKLRSARSIYKPSGNQVFHGFFMLHLVSLIICRDSLEGVSSLARTGHVQNFWILYGFRSWQGISSLGIGSVHSRSVLNALLNRYGLKAQRDKGS